MKVAAHPLVVAVALGFLDPQVLVSEKSDEEDASDGGFRLVFADDLPDPDAVEPDEFSRIEAEWQQVRGLV